MTASECKVWENYIPVTCLIALPTQYVHLWQYSHQIYKEETWSKVYIPLGVTWSVECVADYLDSQHYSIVDHEVPSAENVA